MKYRVDEPADFSRPPWASFGVNLETMRRELGSESTKTTGYSILRFVCRIENERN